MLLTVSLLLHSSTFHSPLSNEDQDPLTFDTSGAGINGFLLVSAFWDCNPKHTLSEVASGHAMVFYYCHGRATESRRRQLVQFTVSEGSAHGFLVDLCS